MVNIKNDIFSEGSSHNSRRDAKCSNPGYMVIVNVQGHHPYRGPVRWLHE